VTEQSYDLRTREGFLQRTAETTDRRIPVTFREATTDNAEVLAWCETFAPGCQSLLILGPTGVGKTHIAYSAIRLLAARGIPVKWEALTAPDLYARLRPRDGVDSEGEFRQVADCELLMLDDLGAAKASEWTEEVNYRLVNYRYDRALPMLLTSNLPRTADKGKPSLTLALGDRVMSRIAGMVGEPVVLRGTDRRRPS
jgi:DNA replication protein DnaC